jgi:hypothetical protein
MKSRETFVRFDVIARRVVWRLRRQCEEFSSEAGETDTRSSNQPEGIADGTAEGVAGRWEEKAGVEAGKVARDAIRRGDRVMQPARALGMRGDASVWTRVQGPALRLRFACRGAGPTHHWENCLLAHIVRPPHHAARTINTRTVG